MEAEHSHDTHMAVNTQGCNPGINGLVLDRRESADRAGFSTHLIQVQTRLVRIN